MENTAKGKGQNSQQSYGSDELDDILDLDKPLTLSGFSQLPASIVYDSQLMTSVRKHENDDIDSGFGFAFSSNKTSTLPQTSTQISSFFQMNSSIPPQTSTQIPNFFRTNFVSNEIDFVMKPSFMPQTTSQISSFLQTNVDYDMFDLETQPPINATIVNPSQACCSKTLAPINEESEIQLENKENIIGSRAENLESNCFQHDEHDLVKLKESTTTPLQAVHQFHSFDTNVQLPALGIPNSIRNLYAKIEEHYSNHSFVHAIAAQMCQKLYPMNSFNSLKLGLLLSIVSCNDPNNAQPISIMALGHDTYAASVIMRDIGKCANRFITPREDLKLNGTCNETTFIEANSLMLARNGVCFIGDWLGLKPTCLNYVKSVLDTGRITADATANINYPLSCAIWMHWSCSAKKLNENAKDLTTILKLFGIPIVLEESQSDSIVDFLLNESMGKNAIEPDDDLNIEPSDIKNFLNVIACIPIKFTPEADALLKLYFMVTRSERPVILSQKGFAVLRQLAECHAKLCIRNHVLKSDVIASIAIAEKFVFNVFGMGIPTAPYQEPIDHINQVDDYMNSFEKWLNDYLNVANRIPIFGQSEI